MLKIKIIIIFFCLFIYIKTNLYSSNIKWYYTSKSYNNCKLIYENATKEICNEIDSEFDKKKKGSCCLISYFNKENNKTINECEALIKKYAHDIKNYLLEFGYENVLIECFSKYLNFFGFYLLLLLL